MTTASSPHPAPAADVARSEDVSVDDHSTDRRRLSRAMIWLLCGYVAFVLVLMVARGAYMSPDLFIVFALVIAVVLGRTRLFLRDWLPFAAIFLAWESMRGLADELGTAVHSDDVIALERFLFFGRVPSVELAGGASTSPARSARSIWPRRSCTWRISRCRWSSRLPSGSRTATLFYRYLLALMLMSFAAFMCYLLFRLRHRDLLARSASRWSVTDIARKHVRAAALRAGDHVAVRQHLRQSGGGIPVAALGLPAAGLPLRPESMAARLADPAGLERRHLVLGRVPRPPLRVDVVAESSSRSAPTRRSRVAR